MFLYLIRHGDPDYKNDCLTELGKDEAKLVAKRLKYSKIDRVYSSTNGRAIETANETCKLLKKDLITFDWAREIVGRYEFPNGESTAIAYAPIEVMRSNEVNNTPFGKTFKCVEYLKKSGIEEGFNTVLNGGLKFIEDLGYKYENGVFRVINPNNDRVALFCHGNMTKALISEVLHIPFHIMWASFIIPHTGISVLWFQNTESGITAPRCLCFGDATHLYEKGKGVQYNNKFYL